MAAPRRVHEASQRSILHARLHFLAWGASPLASRSRPAVWSDWPMLGAGERPLWEEMCK